MWILSGAIALVAYAYAGYPALLYLLASRRGERPAPLPTWEEWPLITLTLPVHNEARVIAGTLEQILAADYPPEQRQVVVISDASTDGTDAIVAAFTERGVELLRLPVRGGKTAAENAAAAVVRGSIVINTDASVRIHRGALKALVARFADPAVGVASCADVSVGASARDGNTAESHYVGYEMWVRALETRVAGIVGASGCLYAIRTELHRKSVPETLSRDFVAALCAWEHGYRAVSVPEAMCFVPRAGSLRREYRRKVRTMTRGLQTLWYKRSLLNPWRHGLLAWMLASHKLCRWMVPWAFAASVAAVAALAVSSLWARAALGGMALIGVVTAAAFVWEVVAVPRVVGRLVYPVSGMAAGLHSWVNAFRGAVHPVWEPTRREVDNVPVTMPPA